MKFLIIGIDSFIGKSLAQSLTKEGISYIGTSRRTGKNQFNLDMEYQKSFIPHQAALSGVTHCVICSAVSNIFECENNPKARFINVDSTIKLIKQMTDMDVKVIFPSTDTVFNGLKGIYSEEDLPDPIIKYGMQKLEVENFLLSNAGHTIVRLPKVYSTDNSSRSFINEVSQNIVKFGKVYGAVDNIFTPIHIDDLVQNLLFLTRENASGLFHFCQKEPITRFELYSFLFKKFKYDSKNLIKCNLIDLELSPPRPLNTSLTSKRTKFNFRSVFDAY